MATQETPESAGSPKRVGSGRLHGTIAVSSWIALLVVLAAWAMIYAGDLWNPATLLLFGPRWLLAIPLLPLLLAAAWWRPRSLPVVLLALLLVLGPIMGFNVPWRGASPAEPPRLRLRVLTCNAHYKRPQKAAVDHLLTEADPDIVAVQELPSAEPFKEFAGERWHVRRVQGLFLASRYPIRHTEQLGEVSTKVPGLIARYELTTPAGIVTLYSLHFASPREGLYEASHHPDTGTEELEDNSVVRLRQSESLAGRADKETTPVLLMGDFNTPTESAIFRRVWHRYHDAFTEAGWGWGYTFFGSRTVVRIDHILAGPGWYCERCWVGPSIGSPHHPVLADLILTERGASAP